MSEYSGLGGTAEAEEFFGGLVKLNREDSEGDNFVGVHMVVVAGVVEVVVLVVVLRLVKSWDNLLSALLHLSAEASA